MLHQAIGAITDQPRAQQRGGLQVTVTIWQGKTVGSVGHGVFCKPTINLVAGITRQIAQVFLVS